MTALCPTGMLFVRCQGGISHSPAEAITAQDAQIALQALLDVPHYSCRRLFAGVLVSIIFLMRLWL